MILVYSATVILLLGALLSLIVSGNFRRAQLSIGSQAIACLLVLVAAVPVWFGAPDLVSRLDWSYPVNEILFRVDPLAAFFLSFSLPMTLLGTLYAVGYLAPTFDKKRHAGTHFALLNMVSVSFILIYTLENAMVFLLGWEIAALSAWLLVIWDYKNQKIRFAGFNYLVSTHLSLLFLVAAFMVIHSATGGFDFAGYKSFLKVSSPLRSVAFLLLMTSFGLKSAFFPFHTWLPRAHSAAPAHVSALMSGVIHKAGLYGMIRIVLLMESPDRWMGWSVVAFSALSAFMGALYTVTQRDIKRLLGYSSTENVGIAGIGIGLGMIGLQLEQPTLVTVGFAGAILHILNHALFKCLLFYAAGSIYRMTHTVDLERLGGLAKKMPQTATTFLIGGLAISALPPFNGFVSEFLIYSGLFNGSVTPDISRAILIGVAALLAFVGAVSAMAITRSFGIAFLGSPRDTHVVSKGESPISMRATMFFHVAGIAVIGLMPIVGTSLVVAPTQQLVNLLPQATATSAVIAETLSITAPIAWVVLALLCTALVLLLARRLLVSDRTRRHVTWGCGYPTTNTRMQYTGSSFSASFMTVFDSLLQLIRRERLPQGPFPESGFLNTHCVDAVERRMFKVLGEGEDWIAKGSVGFREEAPFSFGVALLTLLILVGLILTR